jgi:hypothetical protein
MSIDTPRPRCTPVEKKEHKECKRREEEEFRRAAAAQQRERERPGRGRPRGRPRPRGRGRPRGPPTVAVAMKLPATILLLLLCLLCLLCPPVEAGRGLVRSPPRPPRSPPKACLLVFLLAVDVAATVMAHVPPSCHPPLRLPRHTLALPAAPRQRRRIESDGLTDGLIDEVAFMLLTSRRARERESEEVMSIF